MTNVRNLISTIPGKKALVVGDLIIDYYRILKEKRLSPECPVIVFEPQEEDVRGGGAMNVAHNMQTMGMDVFFFSVGGSDVDEYDAFIRSLSFKSLVMKSDVRKTTVKERLVTKRQALARIDHQKILPIEKFEADNLFFNIVNELRNAEVLVLSDYDHGVLIPDLVSNLISAAKNMGKTVIANTKSRDYMKYKDVDVVILNHNEAKAITHLNSSKDEEVADFLADALNCKVLITRGNEGILLKTENGFNSFPVIGHSDDEVIDVTGAGDTVTAALGGLLAVGLPLVDAVKISNIAADIVIRKRGTSTFTLDELLSRPQV